MITATDKFYKIDYQRFTYYAKQLVPIILFYPIFVRI
jgi:hypothetical protein